MLAGPLGGISVCKMEADEEEEGGGGDGEGGQRGGERQAEQPERQPEEERATREANPPSLPLPPIGRPARVRGHRGGLPLLASSGSLYKHSARRRIDNKHPQFLKNAKTLSTDCRSTV